jgi:hypothetical protein
LKRTKYGAKRQSYGGNLYHSGLEARVAARLDSLRSARDPQERVVNVERQVRVSLDVNGVHICNYYCDFLVEYADGRVVWTEAKGMSTDLWRIKERLFRACYPDRVLEVVRG